MGLIMLQNGVDISGDWGDAEYDAAIEILDEQVANGQIRNIKGNSYLEDLKSEDTLAAICWSGDITVINARPATSGSSRSRTPAAPCGTTTSSSRSARRKTNAETLINYYYEPEVAAEVAAWVNYITPVVGAQEAAAARSTPNSPRTS